MHCLVDKIVSCSAAQNAANKPNDPEAKEALVRAQQAALAALQKLVSVSLSSSEIVKLTTMFVSM